MSIQDSLNLLSNFATAVEDVVSSVDAMSIKNDALAKQVADSARTISDLQSRYDIATSAVSKWQPTVSPAISLKTLQCRAHAHIVCWFGQGNHTDVGYSSQSDDTIAWQLDQLVARGISGVNVLFSGQGQKFNTLAAQKLIAAATARGLIVSLMIDKEASISPDDFVFAQDTLMNGTTQWRVNGKRVLFVFDTPTDAQLAVLRPDVTLIGRNTGGLSAKQSGGAFSWPSPGNEVSYCNFTFPKFAAATGKLIVPHVSPGFLGASWNQSPTFAPTPWRYGQEWIDSIRRVMASNLKPTDVMIATWNDHEEGTGIEKVGLL